MNAPLSHPYVKKLERVLDRMGGLYTASDLIDKVKGGTMQMFCLNDSIAVSQISVYPRARVLDIIVAIGNVDELRELHERILEFAKKLDVNVIQAHGRRGWVADAEKRGWRVKARTFVYQKV